MWKCLSVCARSSRNTQSHIRCVSDASYLRNAGSEPLSSATLGQVLAETAHRRPGTVAVKSLHEGITITYEELLTQADSLGCALRAQGLVKGDRLGLWAHNSVSWIVALVAAARAGLVSVLINPVYEPSELKFCIKKTGLKSILIGEQLPNRNYYSTLEGLIPELHSCSPGNLVSKEFPTLTSVISGGKDKLDGTFQYSSLIKEYANRSEISTYGAEVGSRDGCLMHFTSGTTGEPKAALDSHLGVVNNTYFVGKRNTFHEQEHKVCVQVPLFHALGSIVTALAGLRHGVSLVLAAPTYSVTHNVNALIQEKCTMITGTPTMFVDMLPRLRAAGEVPRMRAALAAGAPCSPQLIRDINKYMNTEEVKALYGLTETTACVFQSLAGDSVDTVADTVGYITDHVEVKVIDENGEMVPFGSAGELLVRGYNNMICYWDDPEKTKKAIDKDGWVYTGDKFTISPDGYGRIQGRLKDIIVRGGENIAPKEIEDLLNTHPHVLESQVVGVSDDRLGEELCAVLRVKEGHSVSAEEVAAHLRGKLARFKVPRIVKTVHDFPKTTSGKIQKYKIKDMIDAGKL